MSRVATHSRLHIAHNCTFTLSVYISKRGPWYQGCLKLQIKETDLRYSCYRGLKADGNFTSVHYDRCDSKTTESLS